MTKRLYAHQETMITEVKDTMKQILINLKNGVQDDKSIMCQAPCGFGKSVVIASIMEGAIKKKNKVLFLVHRTSLVNQMKEEVAQWGLDIRYVDVETNMKMGKKSMLENPDLPEYEIIITDEAHHGAANTYQRIYKRFPNAWKIGFTATTWRGAGNPLSETYKHLILGPSVSELIEKGYLSRFNIVTKDTLLREKLVIGKNGEFTKESIKEAVEAIDYSSPINAYSSAMKGKKVIAYLPTIASCVKLAEKFNAAGIPALAIYTGLNKKKIDEALEQFKKGSIKVLCNIDIVGEGFDVPDCDGVILLRPTKSLALHIQQSMRCMRKHGDKEGIILDMVGNTRELGMPDAEHDWKGYFEGANLKPDKQKPNKELKISNLLKQVLLIIERNGWKLSSLPFKAREYGVIKTNQDLYAIAYVCGYKESWVFNQPEYKK